MRTPTRKTVPYGYELVLDLHECSPETFNRTSLRRYFARLCKAIDMKREELHFWDDYGVPEAKKQSEPHTKGTSAVQFILTSTIVVHTLDLMKAVYVNIFSCKPFDPKVAERITREWFCAKSCRSHFIERV